ncbi:MAG: cache domain-containing protein [Phormidesmis sp.]
MPTPSSSIQQNRRLRLLMGAAVLLTSLCGYFSYQVIRRATLEQVEQSALLALQKGVDEIDLWLSTHQSAIESIANAPTSQQADWASISPYLSAETTRLPDFVFLGLSKPSGMRYTTADNRLVDASDRTWFQQAIAGTPHIDDPFISRATGEPIIAISAPIPGSSQEGKASASAAPIGVIHGGVKINRVAQSVNALEYGSRSYAFLLNSEGRAIIHPDKTLMSTVENQVDSLLTSPEPALAAVVKNMVAGQQGIKNIRIAGQRQYIAYLPLKSADWSVALVIPLGHIHRQMRLLDFMALIILGLAGLMIAALWQLNTFERRQLEKEKTAVRMDERNRLAREIHDTLAQAFTGISLQLEAARGTTSQLINQSRTARPPAASPASSLPPSALPPSVLSPPPSLFQAQLPEVQTYILRARDLARKGLSEARRSVRALRSEALETDTLPEALGKALSQTTRDTGLITHFRLQGTPVPLSDDIQLNLLRIVQEAITNSLRHAKATKLDLTLSFIHEAEPTEVQLCIVDNGIGFDPANLSPTDGFGLMGIRERTARFDGTFELLSSVGKGTTIKVAMPLSDEN